MPLPRTLLLDRALDDVDLRVVSGTWPDGLTGEVVISAPHPDTFWGPHPFFGDGLTHRLSLRPGTHGAPPDRLAWRTRRVDTPSARLRRARPDVFRPTMIGVQSPFGVSNAANTAPLVWGERLFTTWDVGRPVEIDPVSLGFLGEVGHRDEWQAFEVGPQPVLPLVMSTAHPVIDVERDLLWTVNTVWGQLHVVAWDGEGPLRSWPIEGATIPQSVHTITQTRDWLVVGDCAYKVEPQVLHGGERTEPANASGPLHLIRKDALLAAAAGTPVECRTLDIAPEINHYYAHHDDSEGIRVLFEHTQDAELSMPQVLGDLDALGRPCDPRLRGLYGFPMSPDRSSLVEIDPVRGVVTERVDQVEPAMMWGRQLNAMDWSAAGRERPTVHHTVHHGWRPEGITQRMLALYGDRVDRSRWPAEETLPVVVTTALPDMVVTAVHELGADDMPTSPAFVPRDPGGDGRPADQGPRPGGHDGWVVLPVLNDAGFRVEVYDAGDVAAGPVAVADAGGAVLPFVLHSAWMPAAVPADERERTRFADELARLDELPEDLAAVARQVANDLAEGVPLEAAPSA